MSSKRGAPTRRLITSNKRLKRSLNSNKSSPIRIKADPSVGHDADTNTETSENKMKAEFIEVFSKPEYRRGISNQQLKITFGDDKYLRLVPIINSLTRQSRLTMSKVGEELVYNLVSDEVASKFSGLDVSARMVYQVIEKAGNTGIWTKDIKTQTSIQQHTLNKICKNLEMRKLIKPVKAVTAKSKKLYMLYDLSPAKEITGGPWYTELEFDHEFISELRKFVMRCVKKLNGGKGVTLGEIAETMKKANVSRVQLNLQEVQQLMQTLAFDYMIEQSALDNNGEAMFIAARKVTTNCDFRWWDVLAPDFHFRNIKFEDDVVLRAHEPHHHTA